MNVHLRSIVSQSDYKEGINVDRSMVQTGKRPKQTHPKIVWLVRNSTHMLALRIVWIPYFPKDRRMTCPWKHTTS